MWKTIYEIPQHKVAKKKKRNFYSFVAFIDRNRTASFFFYRTYTCKKGGEGHINDDVVSTVSRRGYWFYCKTLTRRGAGKGGRTTTHRHATRRSIERCKRGNDRLSGNRHTYVNDRLEASALKSLKGKKREDPGKCNYALIQHRRFIAAYR